MDKFFDSLYRIINDIKEKRVSFSIVSVAVFIFAFLIFQKIEEESNKIDWMNPIAVIITGIATTITSIFIANKNNEKQKELLKEQIKEQQRQMIKAPYIQREAEIIIEFRNLVYNSKKSFFWFSDILRPYKVYGKMFPDQDVKQSEDKLIVKFKDYCFHYDIINKLNNFYNSNQMILKKEGIEDEFIYITAILGTISVINSTLDFHYSFIDENDSQVRYKLDVINKIGEVFVFAIDFEKDSNLFTKYTLEKLEKYANKIPGIYFQLIDKLDKLTTFYDGNIPDNLRMKKFKYFQNSSEFISNLNKK